MENNNFDYELKNGKIIEIITDEFEHKPEDLIAKLESEKELLILGRDEYLEKINTKIDYIESKLNAIKNLIPK